MFVIWLLLQASYIRIRNLYCIPPCRTNIRNFSIRFQGPKFFNSLSPEIQNSESIRLFRSKFSNLSNWKEEAWKNQGFNGIRTRDLRDTGAMLYQMMMIILHFDLQPQFKYMNYFIYTSHHFTPHGRYELNKLASLPMCGFIAQL